MEPLMSYDGYMMLQEDSQSRNLLSDFFKDKGYTIVSPRANSNQQVNSSKTNEEEKNFKPE